MPTKFDMIDPILNIDHRHKTIMSVNPKEIIKKVEFGTSSLNKIINAINKLCEAGYPVVILIAPVIMIDGWQNLYLNLVKQLSEELPDKAKYVYRNNIYDL